MGKTKPKYTAPASESSSSDEDNDSVERPDNANRKPSSKSKKSSDKHKHQKKKPKIVFSDDSESEESQIAPDFSTTTNASKSSSKGALEVYAYQASIDTKYRKPFSPENMCLSVTNACRMLNLMDKNSGDIEWLFNFEPSTLLKFADEAEHDVVKAPGSLDINEYRLKEETLKFDEWMEVLSNANPRSITGDFSALCKNLREGKLTRNRFSIFALYCSNMYRALYRTPIDSSDTPWVHLYTFMHTIIMQANHALIPADATLDDVTEWVKSAYFDDLYDFAQRAASKPYEKGVVNHSAGNYFRDILGQSKPAASSKGVSPLRAAADAWPHKDTWVKLVGEVSYYPLYPILNMGSLLINYDFFPFVKMTTPEKAYNKLPLYSGGPGVTLKYGVTSEKYGAWLVKPTPIVCTVESFTWDKKGEEKKNKKEQNSAESFRVDRNIRDAVYSYASMVFRRGEDPINQIYSPFDELVNSKYRNVAVVRRQNGWLLPVLNTVSDGPAEPVGLTGGQVCVLNVMNIALRSKSSEITADDDKVTDAIDINLVTSGPSHQPDIDGRKKTPRQIMGLVFTYGNQPNNNNLRTFYETTKNFSPIYGTSQTLCPLPQ